MWFDDWSDIVRVRIVGTAALQLQITEGTRALSTMCVGVGQGVAVAIERV